MRLALRLLLFFFLGISAILVAETWYSIRKDRQILEAELRQDVILLGHAIQRLVLHAWETADETRVNEIIENINQVKHRVQVQWVWVDNSSAPASPPALASHVLESLRHNQEISWVDRRMKPGILYCYFPVATPGGRPGALEVARSLAPVQEHMLTLIRRSLIVGGLIALVSGLLAVFVGFIYVGRPLSRLAVKIQRIGTGNLENPVVLRGHDELSMLAEGVNKMCRDLASERAKTAAETEARIAAIEQLRHKDRLATVGRLAAGVAHELGTPLNVVSGRAGMISRPDQPREETIRCATIIRDQCKRMTEILQQLLHFAHPHPSRIGSADLAALARQVIELLSPVAQKQGVSISSSFPETGIWVLMDSAQIQQVITNIVVNAIQAMPHGGNVSITAGIKPATPPVSFDKPVASYACIEVQDEGTGIEPQYVDRIFDPFFTTKEVGQGTGLGLSIAYGIVKEHGGWIDVACRKDAGSCFSVYLPLKENHESPDSHRG